MRHPITLLAVIVVATSGVATLTALPATSTTNGSSTVPQEVQDRETFTFEAGGIEVEPGGRICAEKVETDINRVIIEDVMIHDATVYQTADRVQQRTEMSTVRVDRLVLYTNGRNEKVDTLAASDQCITLDQEHIVVEGYYAQGNKLRAENTEIVGGADVAENAPAPGGFELPPRFDENAKKVIADTPANLPGPADNVTDWLDDPAEGGTPPLEDTIGPANGSVEQVTGTVDNSTDRVTNTVNETVDLNETERMVNRTTDPVTNTVDDASADAEDGINNTTTEVVATAEDTTNGTGDAVDDVTDEVATERAAGNNTVDTNNTTVDTEDTVERTMNETSDSTVGYVGPLLPALDGVIADLVDLAQSIEFRALAVLPALGGPLRPQY